MKLVWTTDSGAKLEQQRVGSSAELLGYILLSTESKKSIENIAIEIMNILLPSPTLENFSQILTYIILTLSQKKSNIFKYFFLLEA